MKNFPSVAVFLMGTLVFTGTTFSQQKTYTEAEIRDRLAKPQGATVDVRRVGVGNQSTNDKPSPKVIEKANASASSSKVSSGDASKGANKPVVLPKP